jgi:hypothetical protein
VFVPSQDALGLESSDRTEWEEAGAAGALTQVGYRQRVALSATSQQYFIGPSIAWEPLDGFRIGASLFAVYARSEARSSVLEEVATTAGGGSRAFVGTSSEYKSTAIGGQAAVGLQWEPGAGWALGVTFRTPLVRIAEWSDTYDLELLARVGGIFDPQEAAVTPVTTSDTFTGFEAIEPLRVHFGVSWAWQGGWVSVEGDVRAPFGEPADLDRQELTWNLRTGMRWVVDERWAFGAGLFTDRSPAPRPREFGELRVDYYGLTTGVELRTRFDLEDNPDGDALIFASTFGLRYAIGVGEAGGLVADLTQNTQRIDRVDVIFHELALHLGSALYF